MKKNMRKLNCSLWGGLVALLINTPLHAATPLWTYSAPNPSQINISEGENATIQYTLTNQSKKSKNLILQPTPGLSASSCFLVEKGSTCVLTLTINGSQLQAEGIHSGPVLCEQNNLSQCYQPSSANVLQINKISTPVSNYTLSGSVSGLLGTLVLNNGQDLLTLNTDGSFTFPNPLPSGSTYTVSVQSQPTNQTCTVSNGNGTITNANVTNITVNCTLNARTIGGNVSGLDAGQSLVLQNNGNDNLTLNSDGSFTFPVAIAEGTPYNVTVRTQPLTQNCTVTNGSGIAGSSNISNVQITCTNTYTIGGSIFGLTENLVLNNNGELLPIDTDGSFTFPNAQGPGSTYSVTVQTQPATQTCTVSNGSGTITNTNVTNITINCSTNTRTVGGTISGLAIGESVVLQNNGTDNLTENVDGNFTFTTSIAQGATYHVTVLTQPTSQICTVANGSGIAGASNITNVTITCNTDAYTVGGTVTGLTGTLVLQNNNEDNLTLTSNGVFTFPQFIADGANYNVTVFSHPAQQTCTVTNGSGTMSGANVTNVGVNCVTHTTTLSTSVSNLALSITGLTEYGITPSTSGIPRIITITNTGSADAENLAIITPNWPSGTTSSTTCGSTLTPGNICSITINPGNTATSDGTNPCSRTAPVPGIVQVTASNARAVSSNVVVLNYGCLYQGGFVYAFDDTTPTNQSVGGKVASTTNLAPGGIIWSSNGAGGNAVNAVFDAIFAIAENSSNVSPVPSTGQIAGQNACQGATDGACNANNIIVYYSVPNKNPAINLNYYSAGQCHAYTGGNFDDWYLPAICELGYGLSVCGTSAAPTLQNMQSSLANLLNLTGNYWSSTENSTDPALRVWFQGFNTGSGNQADTSKNVDVFGTRCSRNLSNN